MGVFRVGDIVSIISMLISGEGCRGRIRQKYDNETYLVWFDSFTYTVKGYDLELVYRPELEELLTDRDDYYRKYAKSFLIDEE